MRLVSLASAAGFVLFSALAFPGCSKQGEAMRCEVNDDCDTGLTCKNVGFADKICCPDRPTTNECKGSVTTPTDTGVAETAPTTDTGTTMEAATDTGTMMEAATDTGTAAETAAATDADAAD
jgi:hypothetical protein